MNSDSINFGKYLHESIYLNRLKNQKFQNQRRIRSYDYWKDPKKIVEINNLVTRYNNYGFRDEDFIEPADMLIAGCSQTYGVGIPEEFRYSSMLKESLDISIHNIAWPGNSVGSTIRIIHSYIKEFGKPKYIYMLLPPFERFEVVPDFKRCNLAEIENNKPDLRELFSPILTATYLGEFERVMKAPYDPSATLNWETVHFWQSQTLLMFEQYCEAAGIKLAYTTWSVWRDMPNILIDYKNKGLGYESYLEMPFVDWHYDEKSYVDNLGEAGCHNDLNEKYPEIFHVALDRDKYSKTHDGKNETLGAHWGSHRNAHIFDILKKFFVEEWGINEKNNSIH